jgi:hypothetical protein
VAARRAGEHGLAGLAVVGHELGSLAAAVDEAWSSRDLTEGLPGPHDRSRRPRQRACRPSVIGLRTGLVEQDVLDPVSPGQPELELSSMPMHHGDVPAARRLFARPMS